MMERALVVIEWVCIRKSILLLGLVAVALAGCTSEVEMQQPTSIKSHGPHGRHILTLSPRVDFELEFTLDEKRKRIVIYLQGMETIRPFPIRVEKLDATFRSEGFVFQSIFEADPRPNDPNGFSSRFFFSLEKLPQQLLAFNRFQIDISFSNDGKAMTATLYHYNDHSHKYNHD